MNSQRAIHLYNLASDEYSLPYVRYSDCRLFLTLGHFDNAT